jgi:hypothetical protein
MGTKTQKLSNVVDQIVEWQSVFTGDGSTGLTAVAGRGYFIDTTSGAVTVTLPASPKIGDTISINDYAGTFGTNNVTINPNGDKIQNSTDNGVLTNNNASVSFVYMDSTKGWKQTSLDLSTAINTALYITATGGTVTTSTDYKIHTFTGDGCFVVSCAGNALGSSTVDYLVVAGGGGGGEYFGGGAGGGGARMSSGTASGCYTVGPLGSCVAALPVSATTYPVTVGAGGIGGPGGTPTGGAGYDGVPGSNSVFSTITSTGGGGGAGSDGPARDGKPGGSGGGAVGGPPAAAADGGTGNTPPVSPPQGQPGGPSPSGVSNGGWGGGATAAGAPGNSPNTTRGGTGVANNINPAYGQPCGGSQYFSGGGNSSHTNYPSQPLGGLGGGGTGPASPDGGVGDANTGGGGGGNTSPGAGGKGIVVIRYKFQN